jgi:hypothetical protein
VVPPLRSHLCRFEAGRTGADHDDIPWAVGLLLDLVLEMVLATDRRIVQAHHAAGRTTLQAVAGPDARPDLRFSARRDLRDEVWVGDVRSGHPDEVEKTALDRVPSGGDVVDLRRVHDRDVPVCAFDLAGGLQERPGLLSGSRDHLGQSGGGLDGADDDVDELDAQIDVLVQQRAPCIEVDAIRPGLVDGHAHAENHVLAGHLLHRSDHSLGQFGGQRPLLGRQLREVPR